jgi:hypothetical protein
VNSHNVWLGVIAAASVIFFAYIDVVYMATQQRVIDRSDQLEAYLEAARRGNTALADSLCSESAACSFRSTRGDSYQPCCAEGPKWSCST